VKKVPVVCGAALLVGGVLTAGTSSAGTSAVPLPPRVVRSCTAPTPGTMACMALRRTDVRGRAADGAFTPSGYGPADLVSAYKLAGASSTATVAIVDAYDDPNAEADLAAYRRQYELPPCTTTSGCFRKVNQDGNGDLPDSDAGWAGEISLDLDMVSAICRTCHILLVEADSNSRGDLYTAVDFAAAHAKYVSNSWGGDEYSNPLFDQEEDDAHFNHPGVVFTVSSGDNGTGPQYPATSRYVTAVGGTSLFHAANSRGWTETAWNSAGSGCSEFDPKPFWQDVAPACFRRSEADVAAVADPGTGVAVYDTFDGGQGWTVFGGTSAAAPIIAAVYALAATPAAAGYDYPASYPYARRGKLFDVTGGANGDCGAPFCTTGVGWDGPTGLGTPNGTAAFTAGTHLVPIPDVRGLTVAEATQELKAAGFVRGQLKGVSDPTCDNIGRVVGTGPEPGTHQQPPGTAVTLYVGQAPPTPCE
jgi:PASTA domain/Subtilase family